MTAQFKGNPAPLIRSTFDIEVQGNPNDMTLILTITERSSLDGIEEKLHFCFNGQEARQLVGTLQAMIG